MIKMAKFKCKKKIHYFILAPPYGTPIHISQNNQCSIEQGLGNNAMKACWEVVLDGGNEWPA
jgi:hypothetical protein